MPIQNTSLVLSCESHPKCKLKATDNCIKRTLRKVNNPCTRGYKHRCFIPGGNNTPPSLMFLSIKLDISGLNGSFYLTLIFPLWDLLILSSLGSFPHLRATLYFTRSIEYLHTLQGTQHKEDVAIMMYANVCLCQCSGNMYDMKIKS